MVGGESRIRIHDTVTRILVLRCFAIPIAMYYRAFKKRQRLSSRKGMVVGAEVQDEVFIGNNVGKM